MFFSNLDFNILETPGSIHSAIDSDTPFRDKLNINSADGSENFTIRDLKRKFQSLPAPKNDFELVLPEDESDSSEQSGTDVCFVFKVDYLHYYDFIIYRRSKLKIHLIWTSDVPNCWRNKRNFNCLSEQVHSKEDYHFLAD